jgi:hypothetical protein
MFPFTARTSKVGDSAAQDTIVWRLLDSPAGERALVLMAALQTGELRLSEASVVLSTVDRIESLSRSQRPCQWAAIDTNAPYWQKEGHRFVFGA